MRNVLNTIKAPAYVVLLITFLLSGFQNAEKKEVIFYTKAKNEITRDHYKFYFEDFKDFLAGYDIKYTTVHHMDSLINMVPQAPDSTVKKLRNMKGRAFLMVLRDGSRMEINRTFGTRRQLKYVIRRFYELWD